MASSRASAKGLEIRLDRETISTFLAEALARRGFVVAKDAVLLFEESGQIDAKVQVSAEGTCLLP